MPHERSILATRLKPSSAGHVDELAGRSALPNPKQRWTVRRKAAVIEAVRGGRVAIEEVCTVYNLSIDEFLAWERDIDPEWHSRLAEHPVSNLPEY
jgi:hypothetical protein